MCKKKQSAASFKILKNIFLNVFKGPFQHIKNLVSHFLISILVVYGLEGQPYLPPKKNKFDKELLSLFFHIIM